MSSSQSRRSRSRSVSRQRRRKVGRHPAQLVKKQPLTPEEQEQIIRRRLIKKVRRYNRRVRAQQRREMSERAEEELFVQNPEWICIICMEGPNFVEEEEEEGADVVHFGPLINPCKCKGSLGRFHYRCLVGYMRANAGGPCRQCGEQYRDPRIRRFIHFQSGERMIQFREYPEPGQILYYNVTGAQLDFWGLRTIQAILPDPLSYDPRVERFWNYFVPIENQAPTDPTEQLYFNQNWLGRGMNAPRGLLPFLQFRFCQQILVGLGLHQLQQHQQQLQQQQYQDIPISDDEEVEWDPVEYVEPDQYRRQRIALGLPEANLDMDQGPSQYFGGPSSAPDDDEDWDPVEYAQPDQYRLQRIALGLPEANLEMDQGPSQYFGGPSSAPDDEEDWDPVEYSQPDQYRLQRIALGLPEANLDMDPLAPSDEEEEWDPVEYVVPDQYRQQRAALALTGMQYVYEHPEEANWDPDIRHNLEGALAAMYQLAQDEEQEWHHDQPSIFRDRPPSPEEIIRQNEEQQKLAELQEMEQIRIATQESILEQERQQKLADQEAILEQEGQQKLAGLHPNIEDSSEEDSEG